VVKALTSPEVQAKIAALGTNIPSNKAQFAVDAFLNSKPPDDNQPFIAGIQSEREAAFYKPSVHKE
jgi:hypothetical protein